MLADARDGRIDVVIAYTSGWLTRRPREHEDLLELAERHGIKYTYLRSPSFDLNTSAGRRVARILAANDAGESEDIAERVARASGQRAMEGEYHGSKPAFGFQAVREVRNGRERVIDLVPHPEHAAWVRDAMERLLAGESIYGICTEWNRLGRRTNWPRRNGPKDEGNVWYPSTLKRVVTNASIAGYRELHGELIEATWAPIVDRADWERLRTLLFAPGRGKAHPWSTNARKHALSGLVFCAGTRYDECDHEKSWKAVVACSGGEVCGRVMVSMTGNREQANGEKFHRTSFACNELSTGGCGSMRIEMHHLERYIFAQVFTRADSPDLRAEMAAKADDITETEREIRQAIADDERRLRGVEGEYDDEISKVKYQRRRKRIVERLEASEAELAKATRSRVHIHLPPGDELRAVWATKDNIRKRTVILSIIERIEVSRHPTGLATNLTPRKNETGEAFAHRLDMHRAEILRQRVTVLWWH